MSVPYLIKPIPLDMPKTKTNPKFTQSHPSVRKIAASISACITLGAGLAGQAYAQQVAILDSGVDPSRGFNVVGGFNHITNSDDTSDVSEPGPTGEGHGTVSARVITESFSGEIVPHVITDGSLDRSNEDAVTAARDAALTDILGQADIRVVGFTWGTNGIVDTAAPLVNDLVNADKVVAIMAGNDFSDQPNTLAISHYELGGAIVVGATDADGNLLPESNRAGITQDSYVAAIGLPNQDSTEGGTSWATARIVGIAGAVLQQNPNLTANEVVQVILQSAEDRGAVGTDAEYGRGVILSAQQVLNNVIGPVTVPTPTTPTTPTNPDTSSGGGGGGGGGAGALLLGGALAGALLLLRKPSDRLEKTLVLDSYGRAFELDLNDHIEVNDQVLRLNEFFHSLQQTGVSEGMYLPKLKSSVAFSAVTNSDPRENLIKYFSGADDKAFADESANVSLAMQSKLSSNLQLNLGYKVSPQNEFSGSSLIDSHDYFGRSSFLTGESFGSLLTGFGSQSETLSLAYKSEDQSSSEYKLGFVSHYSDGHYRQDSLSSIFQGSYEFSDNANLRLQVGQLEEKGGVLGSAAGGIFSVNSATTYAINLTGTLAVSDQFRLIANYGMGRTRVDAAEDSLLGGFSTLKSDWFSVGAIGSNVFAQQDQLGISLSQPLKIREGALDYSLPVGRLASGGIDFQSERVNLAETNATELKLEGFYRTMLSERLELGGFVTYRQNPNHVADHGDDVIAMATLRWWQF